MNASRLLPALLLASCQTSLVHTGPSAHDCLSDRPCTIAEMADVLAGADVVFLGEFHDSDPGHGMQLEVFAALLERRDEVVLSLEMFERDAQPYLDLYVAGWMDEATFLEKARPWPNYAEHYRPGVELAKEHGARVVAANCYRPLAARVAREGRWSVAGDPWAARVVDAGPGAYQDKFMAAMGDHASDMNARMKNFFAAQCIKDDTMAESIAREFDGAQPLVVHWCGAFHSDGRLGTVERLASRRPDLKLAVTTMFRERPRDLTEEERALADFVWWVAD